MTTKPTPRFMWLAAVALISVVSLAAIEVAFLLGQVLLPDVVNPRRAIARAIAKVDPAKFDRFSAAVVPPMMWDHLPNSTGTTKSCLGSVFASHYDINGTRIYAGYDPASAEVLLVGDSYTHGDEVADDETVAAHLFAKHGIRAANLGVPAYSPLQAVLKAKQSLGNFPQARTIVLGIMYENIRRTVNSYVIAINPDVGGIFLIRPYVHADSITLIPDSAYEGLDGFQNYALRSLNADFWRPEDLEFPFTMSLLRALGSTSFRLRWGARALKFFNRQYELDFYDPTQRDALSLVVQEFLSWAKQSNITPHVILFPQNKYDVQSSDAWIGHFQQRYGRNDRIRSIPTKGIDWSRFNQRPNGDCHPSSYGYSMIASGYAAIIDGFGDGRR